MRHAQQQPANNTINAEEQHVAAEVVAATRFGGSGLAHLQPPEFVTGLCPILKFQIGLDSYCACDIKL